jgi:uncharacterized protein (TIGR00297 family)
MEKEMQGSEADTGWRKAIPRGRDRLQSRMLVWVVVPLLLCETVAVYWPLAGESRISLRPNLFSLLFSFGFAALVWMLRSATLPAAGVGLLVCLILSKASASGADSSSLLALRPALASLIALFVMTFAATRFGRARKERQGLAEARTGRRASQVVANLGVAALCWAVGWYWGCIAALAEAAADTVSSELGQAFGGEAWLVTTFRRVPVGRDGGVSVAGTLAGMVAAGLVVGVGSLHHVLWPDKGLMFAAACAGLVFDSVLGATVEERGWVGNDLVNFASTLFAAVIPCFWFLVRGG